ncbi:DUF6653 family protein [Aurantiacibacter gangjinensis]|uniref:Uncharacterized protein n=1 Tax=Aurantiacibacter gangjinensis TaxID=502682 RepID=A0A0G9MTV8_9SPHN|nr:DUF6653 family protein [Aurantiacibacter gangjinensis]APE28546.1 hypothetical protein BMF35_a1717 [Aurantiacibacter gangjinensis]KLE32743.1 hypothetical protein AAW01_01465 [Aurantiacibacter gangjinensis]
MTPEARIARLFRLDAEGWARHANPWSGWSRIVTGMSLIIIAIWSRVWIGWWSLLPIALVAFWLWINPRLFAPARDDSAWISRGVFGEQMWAARGELPQPYIGAKLPHIFNAVAGIGAIVLIYGLVVLSPVETVIGASIAYAGKLAFIGEMVKLYDRVTAAHPERAYRGWP